MNKNKRARIVSSGLKVVACLAVVAAAGCTVMRGGRHGNPPLRVGLTPNYPPVIFAEDGRVMGIEADLAKAAGKALERDVEFVQLPWNQLLPALNDGRVDVIMSGMSATPERRKYVDFTIPYMRVGQMVLVMKKNVGKYGAAGALYRTRDEVGVESGTTGALFARENMPGARIEQFASPEEGIDALEAGEIDVFVHDAPTVWKYASERGEKGMVGLFTPLTEEHLAWAVRKGNTSLLRQLNEFVAEYRRTGGLQRVINSWIQISIEVK